MDHQFSLMFVMAIVGAISAGLVGGFALMRRMTLAGDVLSHVALPGLGLAILFFPMHDPILGGAATMLIGTLLIWHLQKRTSLSSETAIGVVFAASLATGALITPNEELIDALFGGNQTITAAMFFTSVLLSLLITFFIIRFRHKLVLSLFSPDLAQATGLNINRLNLYYLLAFSASIILGLRLLGALLVGSLIIIPGAVARQLTHDLGKFLFLSALVSVLSVAIGILIARHFGLEQGPVVVTTAAAFFILSLFKKHD